MGRDRRLLLLLVTSNLDNLSNFRGELCRGDAPIHCVQSLNSLFGSWRVSMKVIVVIEVNGY